ncbi:hypothetical protein Sjap_009034 [Stephania japonica]|uniref:Uncharacterized protein n=1 Tax=Stephania japonica TaxID=461633 RepID=A0AAP0JRI9_9MAGN
MLVAAVMEMAVDYRFLLCGGSISEELGSYQRYLEFDSLKALLEWLGNLTLLESLYIIQCQNLISLPSKEQIRRLTSLQELSITLCPLLKERITRIHVVRSGTKYHTFQSCIDIRCPNHHSLLSLILASIGTTSTFIRNSVFSLLSLPVLLLPHIHLSIIILGSLEQM